MVIGWEYGCHSNRLLYPFAILHHLLMVNGSVKVVALTKEYASVILLLERYSFNVNLNNRICFSYSLA